MLCGAKLAPQIYRSQIAKKARFEITNFDVKRMTKKAEQSKALAVIDNIEDKIYVIRGQRVMLDSDLADIYQVETKLLNRAVKRNLDRFPPDFIFQLNQAETEALRRQIGTSKPGRGGPSS